ncbi:hypothetical protein MW887_009313 [Aspergillus wentii]|nr:hypothetical protein MW887_009313 [Aspergillus wentii]
MSDGNHPTRFSKRSRASEPVQSKMTRMDQERIKRRRFSRPHNGDERGRQLATPEVAQESIDYHDGAPSLGDASFIHTGESRHVPWSSVHHVAGQYSDLDPVFTPDEEYLLLGLETSVHVYSMATSRLFRTLDLESGQNVIGYRLCPLNPEHLYIFTSTGSVSKWEWLSGGKMWSWDACGKTTSIDISFHESETDEYVAVYSLRERKDGKREITIAQLGRNKPSENVILETNLRVSDLKVARQGRTVVLYGGQHFLVGTSNFNMLNDLKSMQYVWREATLPVSITCVDIRGSATPARVGAQGSKDKKSPDHLDLVLGESNGSILIYSDVLNFFTANEDSREGGKSPAPRRLHWHRGSVNTVRWSKDGNYVISGGHESVMVLWQLDTGRKQYLPHLSSPICNIIVSPTGNSYVVKLADNCIMALSARELQPFATIIGLQLCPKMTQTLDKSSSTSCQFSSSTPAILHPRQPDQLLIAVPASRQVSQEGHHLPNSSVLQTYDIRTNSHIARQALARTNATTLRVSPEGSEIIAPDIKHIDVAHDGKWMATIDTWSPYPQDVRSLDLSNTGTDYQETFLKFWKWNDFSSLWELVTRIDGPHFSDKGHALVLGLASRPQSYEFVTVGSDALLRFWCPSTRQRSGLKTGPDAQQQLETWKCRSFIDLKGSFGNNKARNLPTACPAFSDDGSVLAVCLPSQSASNPGLVILIDAQNCKVHYSRVGAFWGNPCATSFIGRHLIIASKHAVSIWDTVNDIVRTTGTPGLGGLSSNEESLLLAVNSKTQTFAVATQHLLNHTGHTSKKSRNTQFSIRIYDVQSLILHSQFMLDRCPLALLSNSYSSDYVVIDTAANVKRFGCFNKAPELTSQSFDLTNHLNPGLMDLFGGQLGSTKSQYSGLSTAANGEQSAQTKGLASVFGDVPSFVLPPASVLFRAVVQSLG